MDASAYLRKQGWRGEGHALDTTERGIKKPLLVSKKVDVLGVGLNKHAAVSDQWWLRAFDQGLKNFGTGQQSTLGQVQKHGHHRGGLYGRFVKGEPIPGSIEESEKGRRLEASKTVPPSPVQADMAVDVPPADKLERVVGGHADPRAHDAMMHMLQHPEDAPKSMRKMLDRKRKRAERPAEKRSRRKMEKSDETRTRTEEKRLRELEDGTWDEEKARERKQKKDFSRRADEFVLEAQRRGILAAGPHEIRKGIVHTGANAGAMQSVPLSDAMQQVLKHAGIEARPAESASEGKSKSGSKGDKYARQKAKRELKRAAKAYLMGEKPVHEQTAAERKESKLRRKAEKAAKRAEKAGKQMTKAERIEKTAAEKRERRTQRKIEQAEISQVMAEKGKTAAATNGASAGNAFDEGADEIKFGMNTDGGAKKVPGVGSVERYPTKAEKKAKRMQATAIKEGVSEEDLKARQAAETTNKTELERVKIDRYRAIKHGMTLEQYRDALAKGKVHTPQVEKKHLSPEKMAEYQHRAAKKGISVEKYIKRREEKYAAQQSEKLGNPYQSDAHQALQNGATLVATGPSTSTPGFITDTTGAGPLADNDSTPPDFAARAMTAISTGQPLAIVDTTGNETFTWAPHLPVPRDPRIWAGAKVKDLPKPVRLARKQWMADRREERKAADAAAGKTKGVKTKDRGQKKIEKREAFVMKILHESRKALAAGTAGADGGKLVTIDGVANVPLVKVESNEGGFKRDEMKWARTVARRVLRNVKREDRAKMGKGKGFKKRERSAKEAARNAGISGATDRARREDGLGA